jgi:hypothetical protein
MVTAMAMSSGHRPVCLSGDGMTLAVGTINAGNVHIYKRRASSGGFDQIAQNIAGSKSGNDFGWSISLSDNGDVLAVGSPGEDMNDGGVRLYIDKGAAGYELFTKDV